MPSVPAIPVALEQEAGYGMEEELPLLPAEAASLPEDMLREILSRVPFRSLCRFRCVSKPWRKLCSSDRAVLRRSLQTLSGFVCRPRTGDGVRFLNEYGRGRSLVDPSLGFLRFRGYESFRLLDCCGGLLLCQGWNRSTRRWEYVVCNPATAEIWTALPIPDAHETVAIDNRTRILRLCFDPDVSSRFAIVMLLRGFDDMEPVEVYSSDTREWTSMATGWDRQILVHNFDDLRYVFLNDTLHFSAYDTIVARRDVGANSIDWIATMAMDGNTWRIIPMPPQVQFSFMGQSQGHLYGMKLDHGNGCYRILVWVLEVYGSGQWTLKHTANISKLLGMPIRRDSEQCCIVAIHPERNVIFFTGGVELELRLMSYNMDSQEVHAICPVEEYDVKTFRLYIPYFAERPSDAQ